MTESETEPATVTRTLICHTAECGNAEAPISLEVPETVDAYACGVCGQPITDVQ